MDCSKVGNLIYRLRRENDLTQKQLADAMNISDKTISKWERGLGCPDVSLLGELSSILGVNIEKILSGDLAPNPIDGGNMNRIKFYVCPECGNILSGTGEANISCCGRKLMHLEAKTADDTHGIMPEIVEGDYYITFSHEMSKGHYISFVAYVTTDRMLLIKLYPEQEAAIRFPRLYGGRLYYFCSRHGLFVSKL